MERNLLYKRRIVKHLYFSNMLSCADLSDKIHKSIPLTTKMLGKLMEEGMVTETGYAASTGGRRPVMYSLKEHVMYVVSVAMDQLVTQIAILDMQNRNVSSVELFELPLTKNPDAPTALADKINEVISRSGIPKSKIAGIGIGMPGFVNSVKGINYTFLETEGVTISQYISAKVKLPVFIDNDSRLIALAELKFGAARQRKNALVINVGWGVGLGMILEGELFRGHDGFAGEFSHIPLFLNNKLCSCGKSGCLETETSLLVVIEKAGNGLKSGKLSMLKEEDLSADDPEKAFLNIVTAASRGDKFAVEILSEAGYNIGRGVAILIHLLNPEVVILSGRGSMAGKIWQAPIQQALNEHCIPVLSEHTEIEVSALGYNAELTGAAALVMDNYERDEVRNLTHEINRMY
ncbi:sugar kinase [Niastella yeongjuensis]|uniref:Sugar kinase n=1 Tax=Niastella yeongjuensis TaxID=354355 RepID=A0A1V9EJ77_9BACT|nr:ROK family protein [Niastella yeongjuensis]OQP46121.1 sugar kinase [Niastella yeongjuensis]SEP17363.1 Sugar kinase of the NBD/HSP70 family, may contain an N-terminal HTH domain [Niastella yeongjuensis]